MNIIACQECALCKKHRENFSSHTNKRKRDILELVHTYVCGPMQTRSLGGAYHFFLFIDDTTKYDWVYFMRKKYDVFEYLKSFKTLLKIKEASISKYLD